MGVGVWPRDYAALGLVRVLLSCRLDSSHVGVLILLLLLFIYLLNDKLLSTNISFLF